MVATFLYPFTRHHKQKPVILAVSLLLMLSRAGCRSVALALQSLNKRLRYAGDHRSNLIGGRRAGRRGLGGLRGLGLFAQPAAEYLRKERTRCMPVSEHCAVRAVGGRAVCDEQ